MTKYILLYSGGVDSVLCLWKLVKNGIIPHILHFRTQKLSDEHEKMIKKTAKSISPNSPYHIIETKTVDYQAVGAEEPYAYEVLIDDNDDFSKSVFPAMLGDIIVIGYHKGDECPTQIVFINYCEKHKTPYVFPLANLTRKQIYDAFMQLPEKIRKNTVSTTRCYDGLVFVKSLEKKSIGT